MIPILYSSTETDFVRNGIGFLPDCLKCRVTEELNGIYECEFSYPITGQIYSEISPDRITKVKANETSDLQLFRVYRHTKPLNGVVKFYCQHISYDLNKNPVTPFTQTKTNATVALNAILDHCFYAHRFRAVSSSNVQSKLDIKTPVSARKCFGGMEGSILDNFKGEFEFDNFTVRHYSSRGQDNGVVIQYGKNLTDITADTSIADVYTSIYPYATDEDGEYYELPEKVIALPSASSYGEPRTLEVDFSSKFDSETRITETLLRQYANEYIVNNKVDEIKQNVKVSFVQLWQSKEFETIALLERVKLGDIVTVKYPALGVSVKAKVIKTVYDVLNERYEEIELGQAKSNFADTLSKVNSELTTMSDFMRTQPSLMEKAIAHATEMITGGLGGYVVTPSDASGYPEEILIMDTPDIATASNVLRINKNGIGFSRGNGYNGPFQTAWLLDGSFNADFITAGSINASLIKTGILNADLIKAGTISDVQGNTSINLQNGIISTRVDNGKSLRIWAQGITMYSATDEVLASIFTSNNGIGVVTANQMYIGERQNEKTIISTNTNGGYIRTDTLYADTVSANANSVIFVSNDMSITGALSVSGTIGAGDVSSTGNISAAGNISAFSLTSTYSVSTYSVRSKRVALEKSNDTYSDVLRVSNDKTLLSSDIAEIKTLKVYDTANNAFREFVFKRIYVANAETGNTELMRILVQKE